MKVLNRDLLCQGREVGLQGIEKDWTGFKYGMKKLHIVKLKRFEINKKD